GEGTECPAPAPRALPADGAQVEVFLGLAHEMDATALVGSEDDAAVRRFLRATKGVVDLNSGTSPQEVEWARPNVRVFFGGERHEGFAVIRVAVLLRQENGQFKVLDTYIPPVLYVQAAPFLATGVRGILAQVVARQQQLAGERRQRQSGSVDFHSTEVRKFWMLHTLNGAIPLLQHLLDTPRTHPEEAYAALAQLAGQLCSFSADVEPTAVPKFNYLELGDVFETLFAVVRRLLPGSIERAYTEIGLEHRPDGMFIGKFPDRGLLTQELFVAVAANMTEALVRERVPGVLKLASWNQVYDIVKQARHGVRVEIEWNPSAALPVKPGLCFFRLRKEGPFWDDIAKSSTVALYLPADGEWTGANISLYAVPAANLR
ncbi:MAG TPA: type VI secretion system baseplate subunit TssK, partial [Polyangiaceae bacterium]|nr:type VI secretion system baseplate subunit TssK [Polyangiaceae bacterium]